jgi:hypothetical protein
MNLCSLLKMSLESGVVIQLPTNPINSKIPVQTCWFRLFRQRLHHNIPEIDNAAGIMALQGESAAGNDPQ